MPPTPVPSPTFSETVIPDCCNIGVIFRTLLAVNMAVFAACLVQSRGLFSGLMNFVEASMLVELNCLLWLFALCLLRQLPAVHGMAGWCQRALCALIPATISGGIIQALSRFDWFQNSFTHLQAPDGMLAAALFGLALQHYFELRTRAFSPALVEARLQALQARIRPHFLFNSLNAVLSLIRNEPRRAEEALEDLADLFRVLMRDTRDMTTLEQEIRLCQQYVSIEKIRLGERLQVKWTLNNMDRGVLRRAYIPTLLLQPLLENAVHYGVEPAHQPSLIQIQLSRALDRIEIIVANPYHGDEPGPGGNQMALKNIGERLALLYDVEGQLSFGVDQGEFRVRLRFPYVKDKSAMKNSDKKTP